MVYKVGDWVKSYYVGIWRIERIVTDIYDIRYSMDEPKIKSRGPLFYIKRLVNDNWRRSLSMDVCGLAFMRKLTNEENETLEAFIRDNEKTMKDFEKYQKDVDLVLNLSFSFYDGEKLNFDSIASNLFKDNKGLTSDEIINILRKSELSKYMFKMPRNRAVQCVSINHEIRDSELIFRKFNILDF